MLRQSCRPQLGIIGEHLRSICVICVSQYGSFPFVARCPRNQPAFETSLADPQGLRELLGAHRLSPPRDSMPLDPYSQAVVNVINVSGVVPFRRFHPGEARQELLKLRAPRPEVPAHPMAAVAQEMIPAPDGQIKVRILRPRPLVDERRLYTDRLAQCGVATEYVCFVDDSWLCQPRDCHSLRGAP